MQGMRNTAAGSFMRIRIRMQKGRFYNMQVWLQSAARLSQTSARRKPATHIMGSRVGAAESVQICIWGFTVVLKLNERMDDDSSGKEKTKTERDRERRQRKSTRHTTRVGEMNHDSRLDFDSNLQFATDKHTIATAQKQHPKNVQRSSNEREKERTNERTRQKTKQRAKSCVDTELGSREEMNTIQHSRRSE